MKVCSTCGATYKIHIDFCFVDGDVLGAAPDAMDAPSPGITGSFPQRDQVALEGPPSIVPVEPRKVAAKPPPTPPASPSRKSKHGTLVPGLGSEEMDDEVEELAKSALAAADAQTDIPTEVPLTPPSSVATDVPLPTRPETGTPAPKAKVAAAPVVGDRRMLFVGLVLAFTAFVFVLFAFTIFSFNLLGRDQPPTVIEPIVQPKVVPPTPAQPDPDQEVLEVGTDEEGEGTDEGIDNEEGADEEIPVAPAPAPTVVPTAPVPAPKPAPATMAVPGVPAAPSPTPKPAAPTPTPKPAAGPKPAPTPKPAPVPAPGVPSPKSAPAADGATVWGGEAKPSPAPVPAATDPAVAATGPVMIFFAGRVGDNVSVDGQAVGSLPAKATLTNGMHSFVIDGAAGQVTIKQNVTLNADGKTTILQLSN